MATKHNVYLHCGSIYDMHDCIIENPALLIDKSDGCVHGYGDAGNMTAKFTKMVDAYNKAHMPEMAGDLMLMDFSNAYFNGITNEQVCYILRRAVEYTASSFQEELAEHATNPDFVQWLENCMKKMPIDLSEKEWSYNKA